MNKGVYIGENFASMPHKILILGESHHDKNYALGCDYPRETKETVHNYLRAKNVRSSGRIVGISSQKSPMYSTLLFQVIS